MQSLDIISVNLWQILISLANLLLIFLILKKFLYKPVKKVLEQRRAELDGQYSAARDAETKANADKAAWEQKLAGAKAEADSIIQTASANAQRRSDSIIEDAKKKADIIVSRAESEAELEHKKAQSQIKREIADVSVLLAQKMLGREINKDDHSELIDSFIESIGDGDDNNE